MNDPSPARNTSKFLESAFRALTGLVAALPLAFRARLGRGLGTIFSLIPTRDRTFAKLQLEAFAREEGGKKNLRGVYCTVCQTLLEAFNLKPLLNDVEHAMLIENRRLLEEIKADPRGTVFLSAHSGNWELLGTSLVRYGVKLAVVATEARNPYLQDALNRFRIGAGLKLHLRSDPNPLQSIHADLERGVSIGALIDQDTYVTSAFVPFFGRPARTPLRLVELAREQRFRIVTCFSFRESLLVSRMFLEEIDSRQDVHEILSEYNRRLEALIRRYPDQWVWFHKRWRSKGSEERLSSQEYLAWLEEQCAR